MSALDDVVKTFDGAERAAGELLAGLRVAAGSHEVTTVLDWLDSHGVLENVNEAATTKAAEQENAAAAAPATAGGEDDSLVSGTQDAPSPPASTSTPEPAATEVRPPVEPMHSDVPATEPPDFTAAEAAVDAATPKAPETPAAGGVNPDAKSGLAGALKSALEWVEKL